MLISVAYNAVIASKESGCVQGDEPLLYVLRSNGPNDAVCGAIVLTRGDKLSLLVAGSIPKGSVAAVRALMSSKEKEAFERVPMVLGPLVAINKFAEEYAREHSCSVQLGRRCDSLVLEASVEPIHGGQLCCATPDDHALPTLAAWYANFAEDALGDETLPSPEECLQTVQACAARGNLFYWLNEESLPVAM
eukprot:TRINITY_DN9281_c1_g1_i1.p1 TRINITY_DN9281_c1_g1~~TRINITY_DN9281_c1_g1_i1.p1  ORF type:complete len:192 (+),score=22.16 TRINITY_DN9281_c1_g1_i1:187-762(+)